MHFSITSLGAHSDELSRCLNLDVNQVHVTQLSFGSATVFFPVHQQDISEVVMLLDAKPEKLLSEAPFIGAGHPLRKYVNALPYSNSALTALAIPVAFETAYRQDGNSDAKALELEIELSSVASQLSQEQIATWFQPLGYEVAIERTLLDQEFPEWGSSQHFELRLKCNLPLPTVLRHLRTLLTAMDADHVEAIGQTNTMAIVNESTWLHDHPAGTTIRTALLTIPFSGQRNVLGNLVEPQDTFSPPFPRTLYRSATEQGEINEALLSILIANKANSVLLLSPVDASLALGIVALPSVSRLTLLDLESEYLIGIGNTVGQADIPLELKRKISLVPNSPAYFGEHLRGFEAIILEGGLSKISIDYRAATTSTLFLHCKPHVLIVTEPMSKGFKDWAESTAKEYDMGLEIRIPKISEPPKATPMALAVFTHKKDH